MEKCMIISNVNEVFRIITQLHYLFYKFIFDIINIFNNISFPQINDYFYENSYSFLNSNLKNVKNHIASVPGYAVKFSCTDKRFKYAQLSMSSPTISYLLFDC